MLTRQLSGKPFHVLVKCRQNGEVYYVASHNTHMIAHRRAVQLAQDFAAFSHLSSRDLDVVVAEGGHHHVDKLSTYLDTREQGQ